MLQDKGSPFSVRQPPVSLSLPVMPEYRTCSSHCTWLIILLNTFKGPARFLVPNYQHTGFPSHFLSSFHAGNSFLLQRFEIKKASLHLTASISKLFWGGGRGWNPQAPLLSCIVESGSGNSIWPLPSPQL